MSPLLVGILFQEQSWCFQLLPTLFFMVGLLWDMGVCAEPSLIRTLPGTWGLNYLQDEVQTLLVAGHSAPGGACSLSSL